VRRRAEVCAVDRALALIATLFVGGLIAFQPPVNSQLAKHTSVLGAAFVSTAISATVMGVLFFVSGGAPQLRSAFSAPVGYLTGGLIGAALVSVSLVTVRQLGAGGVVAATVSTQLIVSALLDRAGVLGLSHVGLTPIRLCGFALLLAGTLLVTIR
jgi:transporter family-2 protein